jgi:hypothetical protein
MKGPTRLIIELGRRDVRLTKGVRTATLNDDLAPTLENLFGLVTDAPGK